MSAPILLSDGARRWLANGEQGISSRAMFNRLVLGAETERCWHHFNYPHDPDDLHRCLKLEGTVPEVRERLADMAEEGPAWAALVERWDELAALFWSECPTGRGSAPRTYELMRAILGPIERPDHA